MQLWDSRHCNVCPSSVCSVGKCLGQWERVHGGRGDYLVSLPQLCRLQTAPATPAVVRRSAVSKRQEGRRGRIPGGGRQSLRGLMCTLDRMRLHQRPVVVIFTGENWWLWLMGECIIAHLSPLQDPDQHVKKKNNSNQLKPLNQVSQTTSSDQPPCRSFIVFILYFFSPHPEHCSLRMAACVSRRQKASSLSR